MRPIDAEQAERLLSRWDWQDAYLPVHFKEMVLDECETLEFEPAVDAEPVIRCKNCIYAAASKHPNTVVCCNLGVTMGENDFCSQAETKEE